MSLIVLFVCLAAAAHAGVVVLDDSNFEHLTQASTGATTGDWFVEVGAKACAS